MEAPAALNHSHVTKEHLRVKNQLLKSLQVIRHVQTVQRFVLGLSELQFEVVVYVSCDLFLVNLVLPAFAHASAVIACPAHSSLTCGSFAFSPGCWSMCWRPASLPSFWTLSGWFAFSFDLVIG